MSATKRLLRACRLCGERDAHALRRRMSMCQNCMNNDRRRGVCCICVKDTPLENHHVAGAKHAPDTLPVCLNCHAILSQLQYGWHPSWGDKDSRTRPGLFLIQGHRDILLVAGARGPNALGLPELSRYDVWWKLCDLAWFLTLWSPMDAPDEQYGSYWHALLAVHGMVPSDCADLIFPKELR